MKPVVPLVSPLPLGIHLEVNQPILGPSDLSRPLKSQENSSQWLGGGGAIAQASGPSP